VGDVDRRRPEVALDPRDLRAHLDAQLRVEVRERLVHQERGRLSDDRAAHRDALPLASGELPRLLLQLVGQPEQGRDLAHAAVDLALRHPPQLQAERLVLVHRHVGVEGVVLEDHCDVARLRRNVVHDAVADRDRPCGDLLEAGDHPQQRRLAAARGADQDHEGAVRDVEVDLAHGLRPVGVDLPHGVEGDRPHGGPV
jgi:hypothetical protein